MTVRETILSHDIPPYQPVIILRPKHALGWNGEYWKGSLRYFETSLLYGYILDCEVESIKLEYGDYVIHLKGDSNESV